ncbi:MAG: tRNA epoxyqueuosine(34) reductase QueG, partial [Gammaproteobacteria bacterium]|nr:tRNA epoxyqueuosine(34) reductase QueG [Gammaproteobacteria bacterium]
MPQPPTHTSDDLVALKGDILRWGRELGFQQIGVSDTDLADAESRLQSWLDEGCHGSMLYMGKHGTKRSRPEELVPGTMRVISARMD